MPDTAMDRGSPPWRAARVAVCLGALLRQDAATDDVVASLTETGPPGSGWIDMIAGMRASSPSATALVLPRPGDVRGLPLPRGLPGQAAVGWGDSASSTWLIPTESGGWERVLLDRGVAPPDTVEADRALRGAVVDAAHAFDAADQLMPGSAGDRQAHGSLIDSWVLGTPPLPSARRDLAARGLRMLLVADAGQPGAVLTRRQVAALDDAARGALEAAYSTPRTPH